MSHSLDSIQTPEDIDLSVIKDPEMRFRCEWYVKCIVHHWFKKFGIVHIEVTDWIDKDHFTAIYPPTREWPVPHYGDYTPDMYGMNLSDDEKSAMIRALNGRLFLPNVAPPFTLVFDPEEDSFIYAEPNDYRQLYVAYLSQGEPDKRSPLKPRPIR